MLLLLSRQQHIFIPSSPLLFLSQCHYTGSPAWTWSTCRPSQLDAFCPYKVTRVCLRVCVRVCAGVCGWMCGCLCSFLSPQLQRFRLASTRSGLWFHMPSQSEPYAKSSSPGSVCVDCPAPRIPLVYTQSLQIAAIYPCLVTVIMATSGADTKVDKVKNYNKLRQEAFYSLLFRLTARARRPTEVVLCGPRVFFSEPEPADMLVAFELSVLPPRLSA
jgi:hypothetical protein